MGSNGAEWGSLFRLNGDVSWEGGGDRGVHFWLDGGVLKVCCAICDRNLVQFCCSQHVARVVKYYMCVSNGPSAFVPRVHEHDDLHCSTDCFFIDTSFENLCTVLISQDSSS